MVQVNSQLNEIERVQQCVLDALEDLKAEKIQMLNVEGVSGFTDRMVFATGNSNRHVRSIADHVIEACGEQGIKPLGIEGQDIGDWVLVDLGDLVIHIMIQDTRDFYDIERLWREQLQAADQAH